MQKTDIALTRIFQELAAGNAGRAIAEALTYVMAWPNPQTKERLDTLNAEYQLMESYWRKGVKDPQLEEQYRGLLQRVYVLSTNIAIHRLYEASAFLKTTYSQVRQQGMKWSLQTIRQEMENYVSEVAMLELEPEHLHKEKSLALHKEHQQQMNNLFNYIVTSRVWTDSVGQAMEDILLSPTVDTIDQQLLVSAITLSLINHFDMVKFSLLVKVYEQSQDLLVRQRALVGWVLGIDDDFLAVYPEQYELIGSLLRSKSVCRELTELQMQLVYTLNAEKDTSIIREEIMPDLMENNRVRITSKGLEEIDEDELEDALYPHIAEERMEKLESLFNRVSDLRKQGADVFFGGFSQMKRFAFFYDMSNWLVPFYLQHPDVSRFVENIEGSSWELLLTKGTFCNSDKYSFLLVLQQVREQLPASMRSILDNGEAKLGAQDMSDNTDPAYVRRQYLMDLYRFFRLFPNRASFRNPFDTSKNPLGQCLFFSSQLFSGTLLERNKPEVVNMLLNQKQRQASQHLLDTFPEEMRDVQYYLWKELYSKALQLDPDCERALICDARQAFEEGRIDDALDDYDHLLMLHPGKAGYMLNKAVCLVELEVYDEALQMLYQLSYEQPENQRVNRVLAWALTCDGKVEQADKIYQQLTCVESPLAEDLMNHGYCLWLSGCRDEAIARFQKYLQVTGKTCDSFVITEEKLLHRNGISDTEIKMMKAAVVD